MYLREEGRNLISFFLEAKLHFWECNSGRAASPGRAVRTRAASLWVWDTKPTHGMLTHTLQAVITGGQETTHLPREKHFPWEAGKAALVLGPAAKHGRAEIFPADGEFPTQDANFTSLTHLQSGSYLLLQWHGAFLGDPLSSVEFLPSPAWMSPALGAGEKGEICHFVAQGVVPLTS